MDIVQSVIIQELGTLPTIDADYEINRRVNFVAEYLIRSGAKGLVLGISGGVDSTTAGRINQLAVEHCRAMGHDVINIAVRLPYGEQRDEADAQDALAFIKPDKILTVNIKASADAMLDASYFAEDDPVKQDFVLGNIKARMRMVAQYSIAGQANCLVVGTDHAAEALMGFFTKFGDGGADIVPLEGLDKGQVREIARGLGAPEHLVEKPPTADLENLNPGKLDEDSYGLPYTSINTYLRGGEIIPEEEEKIVDQYIKTRHKRSMPVGPNSTNW